MLKTHFDQTYVLACRTYGRLELRTVRGHPALRSFIAALGLFIREARRDPERANALCKQARVRAKRLEVRMTRLIIGNRVHDKQDQAHRWANAAAWIACPKNGDNPPATFAEARRYITKWGRAQQGVRRLSDLYAGRMTAGELAGDWTSRPPNQGYCVTPNTHTNWFTPPGIFAALGVRFNLDPASPPGGLQWIPADHFYTEADDGLAQPWFGTVWLNPPYGRRIIDLWVQKFVGHRDGVILVSDATATKWWQYLAAHADLILFLNKKVPFYNVLGERKGAFPVGSHLVAIGEAGVHGLRNCHRKGLGLLFAPATDVTAVAQIAEAAD